MCGLKANKKGYNPKLVAEYAETIQEVFIIDVNSENTNIYPNILCKPCHMKLYRLKSKVAATQNDCELTHPDTFFDFVPHSETCYVCDLSSKRGRPAKCSSTSKSFDIVEGIKKMELGYDIAVIGNEVHIIDVERQGYHLCSKTIIIDLVEKTWKYHSLNRFVTPTKICDVSLPELVSDSNTLKLLIETIFSKPLCKGNDDFPSLVERNICDASNFKSHDGKDTGIIESSHGLTLNDFTTIRHVGCKVIAEHEQRCGVCSGYRSTLQAMASRRRNSNENVNVNTNDRYLSRSELLDKLKHYEIERKLLTAKTKRMHEKIMQSINEEGMTLDGEEYCVVKETFELHDSNPFPEDTPQRLLWEQQKKQASLKDKRGMRWHPLIIRWCISLYLKSPGTYNGVLKQFLNLPSKNTLLKYINFTNPGCGFNPDVIGNIARQFDEKFKSHQKQVSLVVDEMKIKSGLVFSTTTGRLVGFCEEGSVNDILTEFEKKFNDTGEEKVSLDSEDKPLASYATALMVRGITSNLHYVFGHFASSSGLTSSQLYHVIWEGISQLEAIGLKVLAVVADGASTNRKFYKLHHWESKENVSEDGVIYWTWNECSPGTEYIKFYSLTDATYS